ncbi:hypothetical protein RUM43_013040 [Polyplax serrata]|uniref:Major facilitator superfamily (MFS) profile domain-containing protein n=1 Tax=Polyplax serrata TaxID=468196 RepID=A0AAN8S765_POLSC
MPDFKTKKGSHAIIGTMTACLSAFIVGNSFGWSAFTSDQYLKGEVGFTLTSHGCSLMESLLTFGAAISCFPAGWIMDRIGRKRTLLTTAPISLLAWCLIVWATSARTLYIGRFLLGISVGIACVSAPVYVTEICEKEIRGAIGSYFQVLLANGVLFAYLIGCDYDVENEMQELSRYSCSDSNVGKKVIYEIFTSKLGVKSMLLSIGLLALQQFSGINGFVFNATAIFQATGSSVGPKYATIILGLMQVIGAFIVIFVVDKFGRIALLGTSAASMSVCTFIMGIFFYMKENQFIVESVSWLPLVSLSVFVVAFSVGFGSVPWMVIPEILPAAIKGPGISIACMCSWAAAFIVTEFFTDLIDLYGMGITLWTFSVVSLCSVLFTFTVLPETKGKSFDEIQNELMGKSNKNNDKSDVDVPP